MTEETTQETQQAEAPAAPSADQTAHPAHGFLDELEEFVAKFEGEFDAAKTFLVDRFNAIRNVL